MEHTARDLTTCTLKYLIRGDLDFPQAVQGDLPRSCAAQLWFPGQDLFRNCSHEAKQQSRRFRSSCLRLPGCLTSGGYWEIVRLAAAVVARHNGDETCSHTSSDRNMHYLRMQWIQTTWLNFKSIKLLRSSSRLPRVVNGAAGLCPGGAVNISCPTSSACSTVAGLIWLESVQLASALTPKPPSCQSAGSESGRPAGRQEEEEAE